MGHQNKYWTGLSQALIPQDSQRWITAKWGSGENMANRVRMLNGAFEIYFRLRKSIDECEDRTHHDLMIDELEDAGESGWGVGVNDMNEAFEHWLRAGPWTDNNTETYTRVSGIFGTSMPALKGAKYCWGLPCNCMVGPAAAVNFFDAIDSKMDQLSSLIKGHNEAVGNLATALAGKNGKQAGNALSTMAKVATVAKKFLFLAPKPDDTFIQDIFTGGTTSPGRADGSFTPFTSQMGTAGGPQSGTGVMGGVAALTFLNVVTDLDTFLSVHKQALETGVFDNKTSTTLAALAVICGKVPVLGGFYQKMVSNIPGLISGVNNLIKEHYRQVDRMTRSNQ